MIPKFPHFKKVDLADREMFAAFVDHYPPYSDFNFSNLWAWDSNNKRMVSQMHGNLVMRFTDYGSDVPFFSFLGTNKTEETALELIRFSKTEGIEPVLKFMPEDSVRDMRKSVLSVVEDGDNFDYLYSVPALASMKGHTLKTKRHLADRFEKEYPLARFEVVDMKDKHIQRHVWSVFEEWERGRKYENEKSKTQIEHERLAIRRFCESSSSHSFLVGAVFIGEAVHGFSVDEIIPNQYCMSHFCKADDTHNGIYAYLNRKMAAHLETLGVSLWNWQQDLGITKLRRSKAVYHPAAFLKKYIVSLADEAPA